MADWTYYSVSRLMSGEWIEYEFMRFFRRSADGRVDELREDGSWHPSKSLATIENRVDEMQAANPRQSVTEQPAIRPLEDEYVLAGMLQLVNESTGRFDPLPPEGLLEKPKLPPHWQYFTLSEEGKLVSIARRDLNGEDHNCQTLNDASEWTWSPYLIEYHIGFEHFHDLQDITDDEAAALFKELEGRLRNFKAPSEPR